MNYKYEAVVIGAGPAGAACGITLQQKGVKHCLVDKSVFPNLSFQNKPLTITPSRQRHAAARKFQY